MCRKIILRHMKKVAKIQEGKKGQMDFFSKYCCFTSPWLHEGKHFLLKIVAGLKRYQSISVYKMRCELLKKGTQTVCQRTASLSFQEDEASSGGKYKVHALGKRFEQQNTCK